MSRITKKKALRRHVTQRQSKKLKRRLNADDAMAMISCGIEDIRTWNALPEYQKNLHRIRAKHAMEIFE